MSAQRRFCIAAEAGKMISVIFPTAVSNFFCQIKSFTYEALMFRGILKESNEWEFFFLFVHLSSE